VTNYKIFTATYFIGLAPGTKHINYKCVIAKYGLKGREDGVGQNCVIASVPNLRNVNVRIMMET